MTAIAIVGAGLAGLSAAATAARSTGAVLIERLPVIGGFAGWEDPVARSLDAAGRGAGVRQMLGATAIRWEPGRLLVAAPGRIEWIEADRLLFAGGTRPATLAELRIAGDRPAGVMSATVADHLIGARVLLGRRPVLLGVSHWSEVVARRLHRAGQRVIMVGLPGDLAPGWVDDWLGTGQPRAVHGRPRISGLEIERPSGDREILACDAIVIAAPARPIRNVEGAVREGRGVAYAQVTDLSLDASDIVRLAERTTETLMEQVGRTAR